MRELLPWLRAQIAALRSEAPNRLYRRRREMLAQCEAHDAVLALWDRTESEASILPPAALILADEMVTAIAVAYRNNPGYREEWRP